MATQASAITFLSTPGQAYEDGMRFVQFYFGLPLAMIVISAVFVPIYYRLKVYTAYEYLEHRFDVRVRYLGALLFLDPARPGRRHHHLRARDHPELDPRLAAATCTNLGIGLVVIAYTVSRRHAGGEPDAEAADDRHDGAACVVALRRSSCACRAASRCRARCKLAGALDRMNAVSFELDFAQPLQLLVGHHRRASFWRCRTSAPTSRRCSAICRAARSTESRLGLLFNGLFKIPMQFVILLIGVLVFVFYLFTPPPLFFNTPALERVAATTAARRACARCEHAISRP